MNKICLFCKTVYKTWNSKSKFCSKLCFAKYYSTYYCGKNSKNFGVKKSELARKRIGLAKIGCKNPMFGKKPWNKNIPCSNKVKEKISKTRLERLTKCEIKAWNKGIKTGQKVWNTGLNKFENLKVAEIARKASKTRSIRFKDPIYREKFRYTSSLSHKEYYKNNPQALKMLKEIRSRIVYPKKDTSIERKMQNMLREKGIHFVTHYPLYNECYETRIDIAFPENKIAVYCDGDYWHNLASYKIRDKITRGKIRW